MMRIIGRMVLDIMAPVEMTVIAIIGLGAASGCGSGRRASRRGGSRS
jgi:hypothetical protein